MSMLMMMCIRLLNAIGQEKGLVFTLRVTNTNQPMSWASSRHNVLYSYQLTAKVDMSKIMTCFAPYSTKGQWLKVFNITRVQDLLYTVTIYSPE